MENRIKSVINDVLGADLAINISDLSNQDNLYDLGLDSLNVVQLIIALENEFHLEFLDSDMAGTNWKDIDSIQNLLKKRM